MKSFLNKEKKTPGDQAQEEQQTESVVAPLGKNDGLKKQQQTEGHG